MTLTRKERESLVIDLLNKCTPSREIAKQAGLSFRDIGAIKKKAEEEKEAKQGQAQQTFACMRTKRSVISEKNGNRGCCKIL